MDSSLEALLAGVVKDAVEQAMDCHAPSSPTIETAVAAGIGARMTYTVSEVAKISGVSERRIRLDNERGLIDFIEPDGERGARIRASEVDRWIETI